MARAAAFAAVLIGAASGWAQSPPAGPVPVRLGPCLAAEAGAPAWEVLRLGRRPPTTYSVVEEKGARAVQAVSRRGAALLFVRVDADLADTPILRWRWRVVDAPDGGDLRTIERDDAAARVVVGFRYTRALVPPGQRLAYLMFKLRHGEFPPYSALAYVWSAHPPAGTALRHPDYERLHQVVLHDARDADGRWREERRDLLADYRDAFGAPPPRVSHVAVMSDADDTKGRSEAW
ncbi:MAG: DUF3047 domain-containing protein, partial [Acidobacteriota bacterium]